MELEQIEEQREKLSGLVRYVYKYAKEENDPKAVALLRKTAGLDCPEVQTFVCRCCRYGYGTKERKKRFDRRRSGARSDSNAVKG